MTTDHLRDIHTLQAALRAGRTFHYRLFYGHTARPDGKLTDTVFSQFWPCTFAVDGVTYWSAEQWMMAGKARLFADAEALPRILAAASPHECKQLGRGVRGFDEAQWRKQRFDIVTAGNTAKFGQDPALREYLLATRDDVLVEASPTDRIWGIGVGARNPEAMGFARSWRGRSVPCERGESKGSASP